jgi:inosose dehydratase
MSSNIESHQVLVGSAPDSWGVWFPNDDRQIPADRFLDELAAAGYHYLELGPLGYLPTETEVLRVELDKRGLSLAATTIIGDLTDNVATDELLHKVEVMAPVQHALGAHYVVLIAAMYTDLFSGKRLRGPELTLNEWRRLVTNTDRIGRRVNAEGFKLVFHPHAETHVETEVQIERFLNETDPALVNLCLDTGHHCYCDGDPVTFLRQHANRIPYLHLKSCDLRIRDEVRVAGLSFAEGVRMGVMCEPAKGAVDFITLRDVIKEIGFSGYAIVEQDMYPAPFDQPFPIAKRTRDFLKEIGIG